MITSTNNTIIYTSSYETAMGKVENCLEKLKEAPENVISSMEKANDLFTMFKTTFKEQCNPDLTLHREKFKEFKKKISEEFKTISKESKKASFTPEDQQVKNLFDKNKKELKNLSLKRSNFFNFTAKDWGSIAGMMLMDCVSRTASLVTTFAILDACGA